MRKLYYSISEIASIVNEEQYILRYWEKEFEILKPKKNRAGNRVYSDKDLFIIKAIKYLIRIEKHSIEGAREHLRKPEFLHKLQNFSDTSINEFELTNNNGISSNLNNFPQKELKENNIEGKVILSREEAIGLYELLNKLLLYFKQ